MRKKVFISEVTTKVEKWNPLSEKKDVEFRYIDLSSINKELKTIDYNDVKEISATDAPSRARQLVIKNDILVSTVRPNLNGVALLLENKELDTASTGYSVLRCSDKIYPKYLFFFVQSRMFISEMIKNASGANYPAVSDKIVKNCKIPLPPLETQKRIAKILDDAAALRDTTAQLLKEYDLLAQSIFLEMFGDPVVNPMGWEKVNFNKLFTQGKESKKPEDIKDGDKYIGLEHIQKGTGEILEIVELRENELKSNKFCFDSNYVLYGKLRPYLNKVAAPNFEGICSTDIIPFSPIKSKSNKAFLINLMRGEWFITYANERTSGANLPRISPKEINKFSTINPPIELQNQFADKIALIEQQKALAKQELQESEDLFNCLLQKAFKGELV